MTTLLRTLRSLKRSPVFFATATISLAIGLGLCTASFLFIDSIQHPHLPYADVDRLYFPLLRLGNQRTPPSLGELQRSMRLLPAIEKVAVTASGREDVTMGSSGNRLVTRFSANFFDLVGIRPILGRLPNAEESRTQTAAVVSHTVWHDEFHDAKAVDGARLKVGDHTYSVVGVLPRGADRSVAGDVWLPLATESDLESLNQSGGLSVGGLEWMGTAGLVVKVRDHVSAAAINAQLATVAADLTTRFGVRGSHAPAYDLQLRSIRPKAQTVSDFEILMLMIGIGVLAIAATNVAALSLARGLARKRDYALRIALGASRSAIAGDVLAEIGVISAVGAIGGAVMAIALIGLMTNIVPEELAATWYVVPEFSIRLFGFAAAALVAAVSLAGALPAWRASRVSPSDPLKDSAGTTTGRSKQEFRVLIIGELAISMVLLMLASLMALSMRNLSNYEFGFNARHLLAANVYMPFAKNDTSLASRIDRVDARQASLDRVRAADGVVSAATINAVVVPDWEMRSEAMTPADPAMVINTALSVSPSFFSTLGVPIVQGRDFLDGDAEQGGAAILSARAARVLFPHGGAIGRMVRFGGEHRNYWLPVVGVVRDFELSLNGVRSPNAIDSPPPVYIASKQAHFDGWGIAIRPRSDDPKIALALAAVLRDALPPKASSRVASWVEEYEREIRYRAFFAQLFAFIATAAMLLGAAGLFSVLSYAVSQRMREFAVRSALGATRRDLLKVVMQYALEMSLAGTAIGALLSFWASAGVSSYLWGVKNTDPVSLVVAELTLLIITMAAALIPAIRATRADPIEVLRAT
jgi:putative ABC transport system permease protein